MTSIKKGERYFGKDFRSGMSARGPWEMVHVADDKGKNEVTVWFHNVPTGMKEPGGYFIIDEILESKYGKRKSKTTDKWFDSVDHEVNITVCQPDTSFDDAVETGSFTDFAATSGPDPWSEVTTQERMPWDDVDDDLPM